MEIRLERSDFGGRHFETVFAARPCLCEVTCFVRLEISGNEKNLQLTWYPSQRQRNSFFFSQAITHFTTFNAIISEFGTCLTQNNIYGSRAAITKRLLRNHLDKISRREWRHVNVAWLLSTFQNGVNDVRIFGLLWRRISYGRPTALAAWASVSGWT